MSLSDLIPGVRWLKVAAIVAVIIAVLGVIHLIRDSGADAERAKINQENTDARNSADDADSALGDCPDGMFDFKSGKCRRP